MSKFKGTYRIASTRLKGWNYGRDAIYFVTVCTKDRRHYFGEIINEKMNLSKIGEIVEIEWLKTFDMRPDMNLWMGAYIIMPNHFHAIIGIGENKYNKHRIVVETQCIASLQQYKNQFGPQSKNLSSIIRGFKIGVTKNARLIHSDFQWQPRYYDHIVRNNTSLNRISKYMLNNPKEWHKYELSY